jgi:hypothetical protein
MVKNMLIEAAVAMADLKGLRIGVIQAGATNV